MKKSTTQNQKKPIKKKNCNCISIIAKIAEKTVVESLENKGNNGIHIGGGGFDNVTFNMKGELHLGMPMSYSYTSNGKEKEKKYKTIMYPAFCPFCGQKFKRE